MGNNTFGMTYEEMNRKTFKAMAENATKVKQERQDRHESMGNALNKAFSKEHDTAKMTTTANALLSGELNASNFDVDKAVEFTGECRAAINSLEKKLLTTGTTAGLLAHQGKIDAYKNKMQEIETIKSQIQLFKTFI